MSKAILALLGPVVVSFASIAAAGSPCRPCVRKVAVPVQTVQTVAVTPPTVFVLPAITLPQGGTTYTSTSTTTTPYQFNVDFDRLASEALALQKAADAAAERHHQRTTQLITKLAELAAGAAQAAEQAAATPSLIQKNCVQCHSGADAKAGFALDQNFDAGAAIAQIAAGKMPKGKTLADSERLALIAEFAKLAATAK